jgi:hypothetical protein
MVPMIAAGCGSMAQPLHCTISVKPDDLEPLAIAKSFLGGLARHCLRVFFIPHSMYNEPL